MEQLKEYVVTLEREKTELLKKLQSIQDDLRSASQQRESLQMMVKDLQAERDVMNNTMLGLYKSIEKTVTANLELQEHVRATAKSSKGCYEILQESKGDSSAKAPQLLMSQETVAPPDSEQNEKLKQLAAELSLVMLEKQRLVAENQQLTDAMRKVMLANTYHKKTVGEFWEIILSLRVENDHLRHMLITFTEKEVANKLPAMEKKKNYIAHIAVCLKQELERMKAVAAKGLARVPHAQAANIKKLQNQYEQTSGELCCLLSDIKLFFSEWYNESKDYYISISKCTTSLLGENLQQMKLLIQIQSLRKADRYGVEFKQLGIPALRRKLDVFLENVSRDLCNLEEELLGVEAKMKHLDAGGPEAKPYLEKCSASFCASVFEEGLSCDMKKLRYVLELLKPQAKSLARARQEVVLKHLSYSREAEAVMSSCRERSDRWLQELKVLERELAATAQQELEEAKQLGETLTTIEKEMMAQLDKVAQFEEKEIKGLLSQFGKTDLS